MKTILDALTAEPRPLFQEENLRTEIGQGRLGALLKEKVLRPAEEIKDIDCSECGETHGVSSIKGQRYYVCPQSGYHEISEGAAKRYSTSLYDIGCSLESALQIDALPLALSDDKLLYIGTWNSSGVNTAFFLYRSGDVSDALSEIKELMQSSDAACVICTGNLKLERAMFDDKKPVAFPRLAEAIPVEADRDVIWDAQPILDQLEKS